MDIAVHSKNVVVQPSLRAGSGRGRVYMVDTYRQFQMPG